MNTWRAFVLVMLIGPAVLASEVAQAATPPVKYIGGAPCRTVKLDKATFRLDGNLYRLTRLTWCGDRITVRVKAVK